MLEPTPPRVDSHLHLSKWWPEIRATGYRPDLDFSLKGLFHDLDTSGIDFGILLQVNDAPSPAEGFPEARDFVRESQGRLRLVSTVDPTRGEDDVAKMIALWEDAPELVGIKLFPGYHPFYPHDARLDPVYEFARKRKLPILIHTGDTMDTKGLLKFSRPIEIDEVAVRFPDVSFVMCHFGNPWIEEAAEVVYKNKNVYADTSGLLPHPSYPLFDRMSELCRRRLMDAVVTVGSTDRILYGSDWPLIDLKLAVELVSFLNLPTRDRNAMLGGNACRLFGIPTTKPSPPKGRG